VEQNRGLSPVYEKQDLQRGTPSKNHATKSIELKLFIKAATYRKRGA